MRVASIEDALHALRADIEIVKQEVTAVRIFARDTEDNGELMANIVLSFRHLEDARMRLGKAIQALGDGVSIYDKDEEASECECDDCDLPDLGGETPDDEAGPEA